MTRRRRRSPPWECPRWQVGLRGARSVSLSENQGIELGVAGVARYRQLQAATLVVARGEDGVVAGELHRAACQAQFDDRIAAGRGVVERTAGVAWALNDSSVDDCWAGRLAGKGVQEPRRLAVGARRG